MSPTTIGGRVTVGDTDQHGTVQITVDLPEPGGTILGLDIPVNLGILADNVVVEVTAEDLLAVLADWDTKRHEQVGR